MTSRELNIKYRKYQNNLHVFLMYVHVDANVYTCEHRNGLFLRGRVQRDADKHVYMLISNSVLLQVHSRLPGDSRFPSRPQNNNPEPTSWPQSLHSKDLPSNQCRDEKKDK